MLCYHLDKKSFPLRISALYKQTVCMQYAPLKTTGRTHGWEDWRNASSLICTTVSSGAYIDKDSSAKRIVNSKLG